MKFRASTLLGLLLIAAWPGLVGAPPAPPPADYRMLVDAAILGNPEEFERAFERAVALRRETGGLDEPHSRIVVYREIAATLAAREKWVNAYSLTGSALRIARSLGESDLLIALYLQDAGYRRQANDPVNALKTLDAADEMIRVLDRREARIESTLLRAELLAPAKSTAAQAEALYEALLADPQADSFRIELERARHTPVDPPHPLVERWERMLKLARERQAADIEAEAHDQLGQVATSNKDLPGAARHFAAAEQTGSPLKRSASLWISVINTYNAVDDRPRVRRALAAAWAIVDETKRPAQAADLHEATGELLGREGDYAAAFRELQQANELRRRRDAVRQFVPFASVIPIVPPRQTEAAAELAAVRNSLREAELERAHLQQRQTAGLATVAVLVAAVLGLAYAYNRRAATALAAARDAAELRAERVHWQMLRYQLNPHFLFNALDSLGGLIASDPAAASRMIGRFSEFCQLALESAHGDPRPLAQELKVIRAYLDVEQAGAGDTLRTRFAVADGSLACLVPPLLLQPLVENALKYGNQTSSELLELELTTRLEPDTGRLFIEVANTGRWVEPATVPRRRPAVGLANVRERLAHLDASAATLTFASDAGWVRAQIRIPARPLAPPAV